MIMVLCPLGDCILRLDLSCKWRGKRAARLYNQFIVLTHSYKFNRRCLWQRSLKVGVIGLGGISNTHVPGWTSSPYAEVVAGCDINPDTFPLWQEKYGVNRFCLDFMDLVNEPDIDIIDICTPNMFHAPMAIAALNAGKDVICEKPLAPTPAEICSMIEARDRSGKMLMTAQHFRFRAVSQGHESRDRNGFVGRYLSRPGLDAPPEWAAGTPNLYL